MKTQPNHERTEVLSPSSCPKILDISNQGIKVISGINHLIQIQQLNLSHNAILKIQNIDKLQMLQTLDLSHNKLVFIENLSELINLKVLNVSHNQICFLPKTIQAHSKLLTLDVSHNLIENQDCFTILPKLSCLQELNLDSNPISTSPEYQPMIQQFLPHLMKLDGVALNSSRFTISNFLDDKENWDNNCYIKTGISFGFKENFRSGRVSPLQQINREASLAQKRNALREIRGSKNKAEISGGSSSFLSRVSFPSNSTFFSGILACRESLSHAKSTNNSQIILQDAYQSANSQPQNECLKLDEREYQQSSKNMEQDKKWMSLFTNTINKLHAILTQNRLFSEWIAAQQDKQQLLELKQSVKFQELLEKIVNLISLTTRAEILMNTSKERCIKDDNTTIINSVNEKKQFLSSSNNNELSIAQRNCEQIILVIHNMMNKVIKDVGNSNNNSIMNHLCQIVEEENQMYVIVKRLEQQCSSTQKQFLSQNCSGPLELDAENHQEEEYNLNDLLFPSTQSDTQQNQQNENKQTQVEFIELEEIKDNELNYLPTEEKNEEFNSLQNTSEQKEVQQQQIINEQESKELNNKTQADQQLEIESQQINNQNIESQIPKRCTSIACQKAFDLELSELLQQQSIGIYQQLKDQQTLMHEEELFHLLNDQLHIQEELKEQQNLISKRLAEYSNYIIRWMNSQKQDESEFFKIILTQQAQANEQLAQTCKKYEQLYLSLLKVVEDRTLPQMKLIPKKECSTQTSLQKCMSSESFVNDVCSTFNSPYSSHLKSTQIHSSNSQQRNVLQNNYTSPFGVTQPFSEAMKDSTQHNQDNLLPFPLKVISEMTEIEQTIPEQNIKSIQAQISQVKVNDANLCKHSIFPLRQNKRDIEIEVNGTVSSSTMPNKSSCNRSPHNYFEYNHIPTNKKVVSVSNIQTPQANCVLNSNYSFSQDIDHQQSNYMKLGSNSQTDLSSYKVDNKNKNKKQVHSARQTAIKSRQSEEDNNNCKSLIVKQEHANSKCDSFFIKHSILIESAQSKMSYNWPQTTKNKPSSSNSKQFIKKDISLLKQSVANLMHSNIPSSIVSQPSKSKDENRNQSKNANKISPFSNNKQKQLKKDSIESVTEIHKNYARSTSSLKQPSTPRENPCFKINKLEQQYGQYQNPYLIDQIKSISKNKNFNEEQRRWESEIKSKSISDKDISFKIYPPHEC